MLHVPRRAGPSIGDSLLEDDQVDDVPAPARPAASRSTCRPTSSPLGAGRRGPPRYGTRTPRRLDGARHRAGHRGRVRRCRSPRPARSSGTGRWACSRTRGSRPAPARSPRRWPTHAASPSSAEVTARPRSREFGLADRGRPRLDRRRRVARAARARRPARPRGPARSARMPDSPSRKPLISGNWKMHLNHFEAIQTVQKLRYLLDQGRLRRRRRRRCTRRSPTSARCRPRSSPTDMSRSRSAPSTATGRRRARSPARSSPAMLAKLNVRYVIVGHSERRELFGETDELVNREGPGRARARHDADHVRRRDARGARGRATPRPRCSARSGPGWRACRPTQVGAMVIAYEPIWAIGTGRTATPETPRRCAPSIRGDRRRRSPAPTPPRPCASSTAAR